MTIFLIESRFTAARPTASQTAKLTMLIKMVLIFAAVRRQKPQDISEESGLSVPRP
jgi:hypothetical protein